jgi:hypothetical protein
MSPTLLQAQALRFEINDGLTKRPLYIGHMSASDLNLACDVPSFSDTTEPATIARNISSTPIRDWQRPLIDGKRLAIAARFSQIGEFMPNPVLLAVHDSTAVDVTPVVLNNQVTSVMQITVTLDSPNSRPLWILDGQHRVRGLASSKRPDSPVPFVLLYSKIQSDYNDADFAKIFAEVSTAADPLNPIHREWLQYAFALGSYDAMGNNPLAHRNSMEVVARLCQDQLLGDEKIPNPFYNRIQLNPERPVIPVHGDGFAYDSNSLKKIIFDWYFNRPPGVGPHLAPDVVACNMAAAMRELILGTTTKTEDSVFFGKGAKKHKPLEDAFLVGTLSRLRVDSAPDWKALLKTLNFDITDWDFSWATIRGGREGKFSRGVAESVFDSVFSVGHLPENVDDLSTYLRGDQASISLVASELGPTGRPRKVGRIEQRFEFGGTKNFPTSGRRHIRIPSQSLTNNIGRLEVVDTEAPVAKFITWSRLKKGLTLSDSHSLNWEIRADFYGGQSNSVKITVKP